ncbi:unnamed protein product [Ambrosiozyma monospora]|uniref:Unnamed protein product n=1 Tax=Ambrosiozyma monospora TaxID=43982 RepID=A0A9W6YV40_AMBMO|nr:unnamed protein product [Ambrosiozyma monospora]
MSISVITKHAIEVGDSPKLSIPFKNVLHVENSGSTEGELEISYIASTEGPAKVKKKLIKLKENSSNTTPSDLLKLAYPDSKVSPSILVIYNPKSGQGKSQVHLKEQIEPILKAAKCSYEIVKTTHPKHASEIARELKITKYDIILCASGDGIPHEVINGLYLREDRAAAFSKLVVVQVPCGSGNAMSLSCLGVSGKQCQGWATLEILKGRVVSMDIVAVSKQNVQDVELSFLTSTYGVIVEADETTTWMRRVGQSRFLIGVAAKVFSRAKYPCSVAFQYVTRTKDELKEFYLSHSNDETSRSELTDDDLKLKYPVSFDVKSNANGQNGDEGWEWLDDDLSNNLSIFYAGTMPFISGDTNFFPSAVRNDGCIDISLYDGRVGISATANCLIGLDKGLHAYHDKFPYFKVKAFKLIPDPHGKKSHVAIDGENYECQAFQGEVLSGVLKTVMATGNFNDAGFDQRINSA